MLLWFYNKNYFKRAFAFSLCREAAVSHMAIAWLSLTFCGWWWVSFNNCFCFPGVMVHTCNPHFSNSSRRISNSMLSATTWWVWGQWGLYHILPQNTKQQQQNIFETVSCCSPSWPGTHNNPPVSDSQVLKLQACANIPSSFLFFQKRKT